MPGLLGIFHKGSEPVDLTLFNSMVSSVNHKKIYERTVITDKHSRYVAANISLATIKYCENPFISSNGNVKILMYGEIYNEDVNEINQLEYIFKAYQKFDLKFPEHLNGSFLILIIDELKERVVIVNDRTASRPLFYFIDGQTLYCAPELKALLLIENVGKKLNLSAAASFLSCGYLLNGETWIENVRCLDNATLLVFSSGGMQFIKYWDFIFDEDAKDLGEKYYQQVLSQLIIKAVKNRIKTAHKYGILLSGGYDSRGILACVLREKGHGEIKTISWGVKEDIYGSDCAVAKRLAKKLGIDHTFCKLDAERLPEHMKEFIYLSDGMTDACANYPESLKIFERIRDELGMDVLLRGDECFGWFPTAFDEETVFQALGIYPLNKVNGFIRIINDEKMLELSEMISQNIEKLSKKIIFRKPHNRKDFFYLDQRLKCYLNPLSYVKRIEIELRNPFIDNYILDFLAVLPEKYRVRKNLYVKTIKEMFPEVFTEMAKRSNMVEWEEQLGGSEKIKRFVEDEFEERTSLIYELVDYEKFKDYRYSANIRKQGLIRRKKSEWMKRYPKMHNLMKYTKVYLQNKAGRTNREISKGIIIRRVLTLKMWCDLFLDGKTKRAANESS